MRWAKTTRFYTSLIVEDDVFNVMLEEDSMSGDYAVYINSEFVTEVDDLPSRDSLLALVEEAFEINQRSQGRFPVEREL